MPAPGRTHPSRVLFGHATPLGDTAKAPVLPAGVAVPVSTVDGEPSSAAPASKKPTVSVVVPRSPPRIGPPPFATGALAPRAFRVLNGRVVDFPVRDEAVWNDSFRLLEVQAELEYFSSILAARNSIARSAEGPSPQLIAAPFLSCVRVRDDRSCC